MLINNCFITQHCLVTNIDLSFAGLLISLKSIPEQEGMTQLSACMVGTLHSSCFPAFSIFLIMIHPKKPELIRLRNQFRFFCVQM